MRSERCKRVRGHKRAALRWPVWQLPPWLAMFICAISALYVAAIVLAVVTGPRSESLRNLGLFGALLVCTAATVELTKRSGENAGVIKDVYTVWELPIAILLPPAYALVMPIFRFTLTQLRIRRIPLYKRVLSTAVIGLALGSASVVFHGITGAGYGYGKGLGVHAALWLLAVAVAAVVQWTVNTSLLFPAIKGSDPTVSLREMYLAREHVHNDVAEF